LSLSMKLMTILEIKKSDCVIVQSLFQKEWLKKIFGVESYVVKNGLPIPFSDSSKPKPPVILWVGSISAIKSPHLFLELAKCIPSANFEMVGGRGSPSWLYDEISTAAQKLPNLKFHGFVPYCGINQYFKRASIFVSTSKKEGFPNVFIQAWAHHTPVVSLNVNPDNIIQNEKIGVHSGTFKQLVLDVTTLLADEKLRKTMGENARAYARREHDIIKIAEKYIKTFKEIF
jgi:glycosyltransferase involved in cell wall biosynthesis